MYRVKRAAVCFTGIKGGPLQGGAECRPPFDKGFIELKTCSILFYFKFPIWYLLGTYQVSREKYVRRHFF